MSTATKTPTRVRKGMRFRSVIADANPLWEVTGNVGRGVWRCKVVNEPFEVNGTTYDGDFAGHTDVFDASRILAAVGMSDLFDDLARRDKEAAATFPAGTVVHAEAGWKGQWVRGTVVDTDDGKQIRPEALIGPFKPYDVPQRYPDGTISEGGYHAKAVTSGELRPLVARNLWESGDSRFDGLDDPTGMDPVDMTVPPMTDEEVARAAKVRTCMAINEAVKDAMHRDFDVDAALAAVAGILNENTAA